MPFVKSFVWTPGSLWLGANTTPTIPTMSRSFDIVACGRPYELSPEFPIRPDGADSEVERSLRNLDGRFSMFILGRNRAIVAADMFGSGGAYIGERSDGTAIAASHLGLIARYTDRPLKVDPLGAATAVFGSVSINGRTPFASVSRLRGCEYAVIELGSGRLRRIATYAEPASLCGLGNRQGRGTPAELAELLAEAVQREVGVDSIFLSGGLDSRAVGFSINRDRRQGILALSYGGWRSREFQTARIAARTLGLRHRHVGPYRLRYSQASDVVAGLGGGLVSLQASEHILGGRGARRIGAHIALSGYLGDILTGKPFEPSLSAQDDLVFRRHLPWLLRNPELTLTRASKSLVEEIRSYLKQTFQLYADESAGRAQQMVDLTHRQAHYIGGQFDLVNQEIEIATPFYNRALINYLFSLPSDQLQYQSLYRRLLGESGLRDLVSDRSNVEKIARWFDKWRPRYATYERQSALRRSQRWLRSQLAGTSMEGELEDLGMRSLSTGAVLPLALSVVPMAVTLDTAGSKRGVGMTHRYTSACDRERPDNRP